MGGLRGARLGRWIEIGWPRLYDGALMGDPFLLEEPFMGFSFLVRGIIYRRSSVIWTVLKLDQTVTGVNGFLIGIHSVWAVISGHWAILLLRPDRKAHSISKWKSAH